jgi:hypothetical protein
VETNKSRKSIEQRLVASFRYNPALGMGEPVKLDDDDVSEVEDLNSYFIFLTGQCRAFSFRYFY